MKKFFLTASLACLTFACQSHRDETHLTRFHDDGRGKAIVTLTPVYDHQNIQLPWSLSEDLTDMIKNRLLKKSNVFIGNAASLTPTDPKDENAITRRTEYHDENKTLNIHFENLKLKFPKTEFVIFMELTDHHIHPKMNQSSFMDKLTPSHELDLCMRIRIYDLRAETPKIILQEMVEQKHLVPKQFAKLDYDSPIWGKKTYSISPIGFAHMQFAKEVASHIENYLILAKTK